MPDESRLWTGDGRVSTETSRERARVRCPTGHPFGAQIYSTINTQTDRDAVETLIFTGLQAVHCPQCEIDFGLAEPLALHDPERQRFALFLPISLSHLELRIRQNLLAMLDASDPFELPDYCGDFEVLVGRASLAMWHSGQRVRADITDVTSTTSVSSTSGSPGSENTEVDPVREEEPVLHEAFADLAQMESKPPSVPPDPEVEDADDWLDDGSFGIAQPVSDVWVPRGNEEEDTSPPPRPSVVIESKKATFDLEGDEVVLIHRIAADEVPAFEPRRSELLFQLHEIDGQPLVVLTLLASPRDREARVLHWFLDVTRETHLEVADQLKAAYRAEVRLYTPELSEAARFEVEEEREDNVVAVLDRALGMLDSGSGEYDFDVVTAGFARVKSPLGLGVAGLPGAGRGRAKSFDEALANLEELARYRDRDTYEDLVFRRSFPIPRLEKLIDEAIVDALRHGVDLDDEYRERAMRKGLKGDRADRVRDGDYDGADEVLERFGLDSDDPDED